MTRIPGLAGSLRRDSYNAALLRNAVELLPSGVMLEIGSIRDIPRYDGNLEASQGVPAPVAALEGLATFAAPPD